MLTLISEVLWHSSECSIIASTQGTILYYEFENHNIEITEQSHGLMR